MAEKKTFIEKFQARLKGVDGMIPYMFPMIGENYENAKRKILVVIDFVRKYACKMDVVLSRPENIPYDELSTKDDNIRGAWENMRYKNKKLQKILEERFLEVDCDVDDVILTSFSRWPSDAKKFEYGINEIEVLGRFPDYVNDVPYTFLQALIKCSNPDEVWFLGKGTERLVLGMPKYLTYKDCDDICENCSPNDKHKLKNGFKDEHILKSIDEKMRLEEFSQGKFKCVTIEITKPKDSNKNSQKEIPKDFSDKLKMKFDKFVQGKEFAKLSTEEKRMHLRRFADHIHKAIGQLK